MNCNRYQNQKNTSFRNRYILIILMLTIGMLNSTNAQITTTISGGSSAAGPYASFAAAITALNGSSITGPVTVDATAGLTETLTGKITLTATGTSVNTITIQRSGAGANPVLISYTGTTITPSNAADGFFAISGSDYITIDGIDLQENPANTTATTVMEFGYGLFKASATDGAQNNTIKNCTITLNRVQSTAWTAPGHNGSIGITVNNGLSTAAGALTPTSTAGSNSFNKFYSNTIQNCNAGIALVGYAAVTPFVFGLGGFGDTGNDIGGSSALTGNTILNFGGGAAATNPANGIFAGSQWNINVSYNNINSNNGSGVNHPATIRGIFCNATSTSASATCNNNTISLKGGGAAAFASTGIDMEFGSTAAGNTINVNNNTIQNCTYSSATTSTFQGILCATSAATLNVTGNTITNNSHSGTGQFDCILIQTGVPGSTTVSNNSITNNTKSGTGIMNCIAFTATLAANTLAVTNNTISGNVMVGGAAACTFNAVNVTGSLNTTATGNTISSNSITSITGTAIGTQNGIIISGTTTPSSNVSNNTVTTFSLGGTSTGAHIMRGLSIGGSSTDNRTISGNVISGFSCNAASSNQMVGITAGVGATVNIFNNRICGMTTGQNTGASYIKGISVNGVTGTTFNVYNNMVDINQVSAVLTGGNSLNAIEVNGGTNANLFFNTLRVAGNGSGTAFGTSGISVLVTTVNTNIRNNIVLNLTTGGGATAAACAAALRRPAAAFTGYASTSDNNIYFPGVTALGATKVTYFDGTTGYQTLAAFQAISGLSPREINSKSENVLFQSTTCGDPNFLKVNTSTATFVESGAQTITTPNITTDIFGTTRNPVSPDIGAHEANFAGLTPSFSSLSASPATGQCSAVNHNVTAVVVPGINPVTSVVLNYAYNGTAQSPITLSNGGSGNTYTGAIPAATPSNATVTWSATINDGTYTANSNGTTYKDNYLANVVTTATVSPGTVCAGTPATLSASALDGAPGFKTIGVQTTTTSTGSPFRGGAGTTVGNKVQYLFTAAELLASGLVAGNITSLGFNVTTTAASSISPNFTIRMGNTGVSVLTTTFQPDPANIVYGPISYSTPSAAGLATIALTPFYWDGVSNILIQICNDPITPLGTSLLISVDAAGTGKMGYTNIAASCAATTDGVALNRAVITFGGIVGINYTSTLTWSWSPGLLSGSTTNASPLSTTTYTAAGTDANGCVLVSNSVTLNVNPLPPNPVGTNSTQCGYGTPTASVTGSGGIFRWYLAASGGSPLAGQSGNTLSAYPISVTTTFYVSEYDGTCEGFRTPVVAFVTNPDAVTASTSTLSTCPFTNVQLTATQTGSTNSYTYSWSASPAIGSGIPTTLSGSSLTIQATASGTYTYTVLATDPSLSCATISSVSITFNINPIVSVTPSSVNVCPNTPTQLNAIQTNAAGLAYSFSGVNQYIAIPPTASLDLTSAAGNSLTLEAWVYETAYPTVAPGDAGIISHYQSSSGASYFLRTSEVSPYSGLGAGAGTAVVSASGTMPLGTWTHVAAIFSYNSSTLNDSVKLYKNGVLLNKGVTTIGHSPDSLRIGSDFGARYFNGILDEIRIWNVALSESTLNTWMAQSITSSHPNYANLVAYYDFNTPSSTTVTDLSSNGNTGYLRNGPTQVTSGIPFSSATFSWLPTLGLSNPSISNPIATPSSPTTYIVTATSQNGCFGTASSIINLNQLPAAPTTTNSVQCGIGVPTASASGIGSIFHWYLNPTGGTALTNQNGSQLSGYSISTTTTFYVSELAGGLCEGPRAPVVATVVDPDAVVATASSPTCLGSTVTLTANQSGPNGNPYTFSWTASPSTGSGMSGILLGPLTSWYSNDFSTGLVGSDALSGVALITGGELELTSNTLSQSGAFTVNNPSGIDPSYLDVSFNLTVTPAAGADGFSYSYGDDVSATSTTPNFENGTGSKLKLAFDAYTNATNTAGIYLMYNTNTLNQPPTDPGVIAYSSDVSWRNATNTPISLVVNELGKATLIVGTTTIFSNVQLPAAYAASTKSTWKHVFKARTGGISELHHMDNLNIKYKLATSVPTLGQSVVITPTATGTYTYTVLAYDGNCTTSSTVSITVTPSPNIVSATASPNPACSGENVVLNAKTYIGGSFTGNIGSGTTTTTTSGILPYPVFWETTRLQYLVSASELTAAGFSAGNITQIKYIISATTAAVAWQNYTIKMGQTSNTALTSAWENTLTTVYGPLTVAAPPAVGQNTHTLTTPFAWNGTSNLVIDICYTNDPTATCTSCYSASGSVTVPYTTTSFVSVHYSQSDNTNNCGTANVGTLVSTRPNFILVGTNQIQGAGSYNWQWNPGAYNSNSVTITPTATNTYTVTATDPASGCTASQSVVSVVNPRPSTPAKQDDAQCGPGIPTCYVTGGGGIFRWYLTPTGGSPIAGETGTFLQSYSISNTTTFYVAEYDGTCESFRVPVIQFVSTPGPISVSAGTNGCLGSVVHLTLNNPSSYPYFSFDWTSNPASGSGISGTAFGDPMDGHIDVTPTASGTYTYSVLASDGLCNAGASIIVTILVPPTVTVTPTVTSACPNSNTQLLATQTNGAGNAVLLNGTNQYLAIPHSSSLAFSAGAGSKFTIEAWIRPAAFTQFAGIVSKYQVTGFPGYFLRENTTSPFTGIDAGGSGTVSTATGLLAANNWYHVAAVYFPKDATNDSVRIYINGTLVKSGVTLMPANTDSVRIGSDFSSRYFNGQIDEVRIWNDTLPSNTISNWRTLSITNVHPNFANLVAYYNFNAPASATVADLSGNGNTAYVRNSPTFVSSTASISTVTFSWSPTAGLSNPTIANPVASPNITTTYTVTASAPNGCSTTASTVINVVSVAASPIATNGTVCGYGVPNCTATPTGGGVIRWYLAPTGGTPLAGENGNQLTSYSISTNTTFYVSEYDGTCESARTPVEATVVNPDAITATATPNPICANSPLTLSAVQTGTTNNYIYSWTASPILGSGMSGIVLGLLTTLYSNDFSTGLVGGDAITDNALFTGGELELTSNTLSQRGALTVNNPGAVNPLYLAVSFNLTVTPSGGADGISYSYGDDVSATSTAPNFENGTGSKLKLSFDAYTNGTNTNGIYLIYNNNSSNQSPGDPGVIAYSSNVAWRNAVNTAISFVVDELGRATLIVGGATVFNNIQLPAAYSAANKSTWYHVFKARTGGVSELHHLDNVLIQYKTGNSTPTLGQNVIITPTAGGTYTYTVTATDAGSNCITTSAVTVTVVNPPVIASVTASPSTICLGQSSVLTALTTISSPGISNIGTFTTTVSTTGNPYYSGIGIGSDVKTQIMLTASELTAAGFTAGNITSLGFTTSSATGTLSNFTIKMGATALTALTATFAATPMTIVFTQATFSPIVGLNTHTFSTPFLWDGSSNVVIEICQTNNVLGSVVTSAYSTSYQSDTYLSGVAACSGLTGTISSIKPIMQIGGNIVGTGAGTLNWTWNPGNLSGNVQTVTPSASTTYTVTASDPTTLCTSASTVTVDVISIVNVPVAAANPSVICGTGPVTLSVSNTQAAVSYSWESSPTGLAGSWTVIGNTATLTTGILTQDTYFRVTSSCGTSSAISASILVSVANPNITLTTGATRCGIGQVNLSVAGNGSFDWYSSSSGGTPLATNTASYSTVINATTSFWIQAYIGSCINPAGRQLVTAIMNPAPVVSVTSNPGTTICSGNTVTLTASSANPDYTYNWSTDGINTLASGSVYAASPASNTTYYLNAIDNSGGTNAGCAYQVTTNISVNQSPPVPVITPSNPAICSTGGCTNLTVANGIASSPGTVTIGTGTVVNAITAYPSPYGQFYGSSHEQYLVKASELSAAGLVAGNINSIAWELNAGYTYAALQNFKVSIGATAQTALTTTLICAGLTTVVPSATYTPPSVAGWATINFTNPFLWDGISNIVVDVSFSNCSVCNGTSSCTTSFTDNGAVKQTATSFVSTVNFHADANCTINSCTPSNTGTTYSQRPNIQFSGTVGSPITYTWNPGNVAGLTYNVCPTANTTYTVVASVPSGCTTSASVTVQYAPIPNPSIVVIGTTNICPGGSLTLDATNTGFTNYSWSNGVSVVSTNSSFIASPGVTTTYTVTVNNGATCSKTTSKVVTVANLPPPSITGGGSPICEGSNATLNAGSGYDSYSWSDGTGIVSTGNLYVASPAVTTTYTVTVTLNSCSAVSSGTVVQVNPNPPLAAITPAGPIALCSDGSNSPLALTADITGAPIGATIVWNQDGNPSTSGIVVSAGDIDLLLNGGSFGYSFQVTNPATGCFKISNTVTVNEGPCSGPTLYAKLFLEGFYSGSGDMNNSGSGGCLNITGGSANPLDADNVTLSAMSSTAPYGLVESQTGILKTNGNINVTFTNAVSNGSSYYIKVTHRNSLETWSAAPVILSATSALSPYDFSSAQTQAYGSNLSDLFDGNWAIYSGDISDATSATVGIQDGIIESQDYGDMENAVYVTLLGYVTEDITGDGIVESADYGLMENNVYFTRVLQRP